MLGAWLVGSSVAAQAPTRPAPTHLHIERDTTPPTVISTTRLNPDGTLPTTSTITFQFSEPMDPTSLGADVVKE